MEGNGQVDSEAKRIGKIFICFYENFGKRKYITTDKIIIFNNYRSRYSHKFSQKRRSKEISIRGLPLSRLKKRLFETGGGPRLNLSFEFNL